MRCWSSRGLPPAYRWHPLSGGQCRFHHLFSPHPTFFSEHLKRKESLVLCIALTKITELFTRERLSVKCHPRPCYARKSAERENKGGQLIPRGFIFMRALDDLYRENRGSVNRLRKLLQRSSEHLLTKHYHSFPGFLTCPWAWRSILSRSISARSSLMSLTLGSLKTNNMI